MSGRLPFDPGRMAARRALEAERAAVEGDGDGAISVSDLAVRIEAAIRQGAGGRFRVQGEVSGFRDRTHWYFDLKDAGAVISCVCFASSARRSRCRPENGREVVATGRLDFYAPGGKVSLLVEKLEEVGDGASDAALKRLIEELRGLGWLDPESKKPLPRFPRRVAVVTSRTGAALQDVLDTMRRRCPAVGVLVVDVRVQGERAGAEVAAALRGLDARREELGIDAVLVTRGGGSKEDLWAFNERAVAEAIHACSLPVVAAIGHETDVTLAELVADERCATPTQAAVRLTPDREALARQIDALARRLGVTAQQRVRYERQRLAGLGRSAALADPRTPVRLGRQRVEQLRRALCTAAVGRLREARREVAELARRLDGQKPAAVQARSDERLRSLERRLREAVRRRSREADVSGLGRRLRQAAMRAVRDERAMLDGLERELLAVGPQRVLERGYTLTTDAAGRVVRTAGQVRPGDRVRTRTAEGEFGSVVEGAAGGPGDAPAPARAPAPRPSRRRRVRGAAGPRDQMDLF